ncbi:MAG: DUF4358 domain-containing protein [Eubacterium sp.]|nr:DUF4358 domain-containing protein [Eubacterium sp.]
MNIKKMLTAVLIPAMLFTACGGENGGAQSSAVDVDPADAVKAVLAEVPISSSVEKGTDDVETYYVDVDITELESAAFSLCGSGALPDEIAVFRFATAEAASSAEVGLQSKLDSRIELFKDYTPDEMYKLDTAKIYSIGNYAVYLSVSDNDRAKAIVDEMLKG